MVLFELTNEQRAALGERLGTDAVPVVDPRDNRSYYLVPAEVFERLQRDVADEDSLGARDAAEREHAASGADVQIPAEQTGSQLPMAPVPIIQKAIDAYRRDLPEMLKKHRGQWVAYHGDERLGFGRKKTQLYDLCRRRGLNLDDVLVCGVAEDIFDPDDEVEIFFPV